MVLVLAQALVRGDFGAEGAVLTALPWGRATLVDVYVGLALFCGWIASRGHRPLGAGAWIVAVMVLGNLAACCYVGWAVLTSRGNPVSFWMGDDDEA